MVLFLLTLLKLQTKWVLFGSGILSRLSTLWNLELSSQTDNPYISSRMMCKSCLEERRGQWFMSHLIYLRFAKISKSLLLFWSKILWLGLAVPGPLNYHTEGWSRTILLIFILIYILSPWLVVPPHWGSYDFEWGGRFILRKLGGGTGGPAHFNLHYLPLVGCSW